MGLFSKKKPPKRGSFKVVKGVYYVVRNGQWVKASPEAQAQFKKNTALNQANVGGTNTLTNKNQPKANPNRSKVSAKNNSSNNNTSGKKSNKDGIVELNGKTYNLNDRKQLSAYNVALKASKTNKANPPKEASKKSNLKTKVTDHKDTGHTKLVKDSSGKVRRVKVSDTTKDKTLKGSDTSKMKSKPSVKSTVHTRHYKTGERLGVMTRNQRRAYEKEAGDKTFEQRVADHEKSSGHGKSHLRETLYKKSLRKGGNKNSSSNKGSTNRNKLESTQSKSMPSNPPDKKKKKGFWHGWGSETGWDPGGISGHFDG